MHRSRRCTRPPPPPDCYVRVPGAAVLVRRPSSEAARQAHAALFQPTVSLALSSADTGVLQSAAELLRALLRAAGTGEQLAAWGADGAGGGDAPGALLGAAARLLSPQLEERAAQFVGPLLTAMLRRLPQQMAPLLPAVAAALVARLRACSVPAVITSLLAVFAQIAHAGPAQLVDLLLAQEAGGATGDALVYVMRQWTQWACDIQGAAAIKASTTALAALLACGHPALASVTVRGRLIEAPSGGIRTRARAAAAGPERYGEEALPAKLLALVADALLEEEEAEAAQWVEDDDDDEDEEGDEEEGGGIGGGGGGSGEAFVLQRLGAGAEAEQAEGDADAADDPLAGVDTRSFVRERLHALAALPGAAALAQSAAALTQRQQAALQKCMAATS